MGKNGRARHAGARRASAELCHTGAASPAPGPVAQKPAARQCGRFPFCYAFLFFQRPALRPTVKIRFLGAPGIRLTPV